MRTQHRGKVDFPSTIVENRVVGQSQRMARDAFVLTVLLSATTLGPLRRYILVLAANQGSLADFNVGTVRCRTINMPLTADEESGS